MKLDHLSLEQLKLSPLNVRRKGGKDIADLLPLVRRLGIIQPLLVRPNCEGFEIVAGQWRYNTLLALAEEGIAEPVPASSWRTATMRRQSRHCLPRISATCRWTKSISTGRLRR